MTNMIFKKPIVFATLIFFSCQFKKENTSTESAMLKENVTVANILQSNPNTVLVIAHRGDWRNAPENSLQAIQNCIEMGVDMVEIDVRLTKDSIPVLMHDSTIDRTTTGKGKVADWTLEGLKTLYLKNGANHATNHRIPTLEEALLVAKREILLNLDKCYDQFDLIYPILKKTKTTSQILMKGKVSIEEVREDFKDYLGSIVFMPIISLDHEDALEKVAAYLNAEEPPLAIEFVFSDLKSPIIKQFKSIHDAGTRVWVNSLWKSLNAGYEDEVAVEHTDSIYGWYVRNKISMIQTDRPQLLMSYLKSQAK